MKKLGLMLLLFALFLAGCSSASNENEEKSTVYLLSKMEKYGLDGSLSEVTEYTYNENGVKTAEVCKDGDGNETKLATYTLDDDGRLATIEYKDVDSNERISLLEYDENGNLVQQTENYKDDFTLVYKYTYNDNHQIIESQIYSDDKLESKILTEYDADGKISVTEHYSSNFDYPQERLENYQYDEHGNVTGWHRIEYNNDGSILSESDIDSIKNTYDGDLCVKIQNSYSISEYAYDDAGNVIELKYSTYGENVVSIGYINKYTYTTLELTESQKDYYNII